MPTKRAKDLRAGDRFSYVGAFKTYVAVSDAAPSSPGYVLLDADAGPIQGVIQVQLLEERECTLEEPPPISARIQEEERK